MFAFPLQRSGRKFFGAAEAARSQAELCRFFHNDDELSSRERIAAEGEQSMIGQEYGGYSGMELDLPHDIAYRFWRATRSPLRHRNILSDAEAQKSLIDAGKRLVGE